jgi:hypothetical protein
LVATAVTGERGEAFHEFRDDRRTLARPTATAF